MQASSSHAVIRKIAITNSFEVRAYLPSVFESIRKIASCTALLWVVIALTLHVSLNQTLLLMCFLLLFFQLCVHQVIALALEGMYIRAFRLHVHVGRC